MNVVDALRRDADRYGAGKAAYALGMRGLQRVCDFRILKGIATDTVSAEYLEIDVRFEHGFATAETLARFSGDAVYDMPPEFLREALAKGDRCYVITAGDKLASFGWYSTAPTLVTDALVLHFDPSRAYMYKGFTHPDYRGQRLHAIGMTWALRRLLETGSKGLVSIIYSTNLASLKSSYRMGFRDFGNAYILQLGARRFVAHDARCAAYGFRVSEWHGASGAGAAGETSAQG